MTAIKLDTKLASAASDSLDPHGQALYERPGKRILGVIELAHWERSQPAPEADKQASVKLRITHLEIANQEQEGALREAQRALYLHRTARGTLGEDGMIELAPDTLDTTAGLLHAIETARLRAALGHWAEYAKKVTSAAHHFTDTEIRHELDTIADGLTAALRAGANGQESD